MARNSALKGGSKLFRAWGREAHSFGVPSFIGDRRSPLNNCDHKLDEEQYWHQPRPQPMVDGRDGTVTHTGKFLKEPARKVQLMGQVLPSIRGPGGPQMCSIFQLFYFTTKPLNPTIQAPTSSLFPFLVSLSKARMVCSKIF